MNNYKTRLQLKTEVKQLLQGNWGRAILLFVVPMIYGAVVSVPMNILTQVVTAVFIFSNSYTLLIILGIILFLIVVALVLLMAIPMYTALFKGLDWLRDDKLQFNAFLTGLERFKNPDWWQIALLSLITGFLSFLWSLLLVVPGIIKLISYSQAFYLYKDAQEKGLNDHFAMTDYVSMSRKLMNGHKKDYFVLQLSFLGWWLLSILTMGIGNLWFMPYYNLTLANFYRDLIDHNSDIFEFTSTKKTVNPNNPAIKRRRLTSIIAAVLIAAGLVTVTMAVRLYTPSVQEEIGSGGASGKDITYLTNHVNEYYKNATGVKPEHIRIERVNDSFTGKGYSIASTFNQNDMKKSPVLKKLSGDTLTIKVAPTNLLGGSEEDTEDNLQNIWAQVNESLGAQDKAVNITAKNKALAKYYFKDIDNTNPIITDYEADVENEDGNISLYDVAMIFSKTHRIDQMTTKNVISWIGSKKADSGFLLMITIDLNEQLDPASSQQFIETNIETN